MTNLCRAKDQAFAHRQPAHFSLTFVASFAAALAQDSFLLGNCRRSGRATVALLEDVDLPDITRSTLNLGRRLNQV
jgi:hypothetical protein